MEMRGALTFNADRRVSRRGQNGVFRGARAGGGGRNNLYLDLCGGSMGVTVCKNVLSFTLKACEL